jgi:DtxR family Mn-dependent transcriptional regulator
MSEALSASLEDYLEAIYHIAHHKGAARPKDIAVRLGVNSSSVTGALRALADRQLVNYAPYDIVTLTPEGEVVAGDVVRRHRALKDFFVKVLSVDEELAEEGACKMEHEIPRPILERFIKFVEFIDSCPRAGKRFTVGFSTYVTSGCRPEDCEQCLTESLDQARGHTR